VVKTIHRADYRHLVDMLRERREVLGVSQSELARELGWKQQKVSFIETGARRMDVLEYIALSRALGLSPLGAFRRAEQALRNGAG
jgi:transcriptional regulator with XRE-family HTH domain